MIDQYIPCPNCQAAIGLSTESRPIVNEAVDNFEKLKKLSPQKE